jgi:hypothetical protein
MKKIIVTLFCLFTFSLAQAQYDNWAVGFKLGEPTGIQVRKYFNNVNAIDVSFGTYGFILGNDREYRQGQYRSAGVSFQAHYLWHTALFNSEKAQIYYGFGPQINSRNYYPDNQQTQQVKFQKNISLGGSGLGGFEFFLPDGRMSVFMEGGVYIELLPGPFFTSPNVSGGIRLNL